MNRCNHIDNDPMGPNELNANLCSEVCRQIDLDELKCEFSSLRAKHVNARDLRRISQYEELRLLLGDGEVSLDVAMVSETWFDAYDAANYGIPGYNCIQSFRPGGGGGGVAIYVHSTLHLDSSEQWCSEEGSVQIVKIKILVPVSRVLSLELTPEVGSTTKLYLTSSIKAFPRILTYKSSCWAT